jgi:DNA (cytosine-5)-methyltransferase 1
VKVGFWDEKAAEWVRNLVAADLIEPAYYNEINPHAAAWLRNLIDAGHIAPGFVDERSIEDVRPSDLAGFAQCHFFAGIGIWSLALRRAGWPDDKRVWTGSCPCQPFSQAGEGGGFADERHLWPHWFHLITQRRPDVILGEQVASKDGLAWLDLVHADMEAANYGGGGGLSIYSLRASALRTSDNGCIGLPTPSGTSNHGRNHVSGRLDEWGGSGNPFRGTEVGRLHLPGFELWVMGIPDAWRPRMPLATQLSRKSQPSSSKP